MPKHAKPTSKPMKLQRLIERRADALQALLGRKPGQKHYRQALKAFLEADTRLEKARMSSIEARLGRLEQAA